MTLKFETDHPVLAAQNHIDELLQEPTQTAHVAGSATHPKVYMHDLSRMTRIVINCIVNAGVTYALNRYASHDTVDQLAALLAGVTYEPTTSGARLLHLGVVDVRLMAASTVIASEILTLPTSAEIAARLNPVHRPNGAFEHFPLSTEVHSPALLAAAASVTPQRRHVRDSAVRAEVALYAPAALKEVSSDLIPARMFTALAERHDLEQDRNGRSHAALSAGMLSLNEGLTLETATGQLNLEHVSGVLVHEWRALMTADKNGTLLRDLFLLRAALKSQQSPINWARRRHTFPRPVVPATRLITPIARELNTRKTNALATWCALWLFERLSGSDALLTPAGLGLPGNLRVRYRAKRSAWNYAPPVNLLLLVERSLLEHRIDEPLRWQPQINAEGEWECPAPSLERTLPAWNSRALRRGSRIGIPPATQGPPPNPLEGKTATPAVSRTPR